MGKMEEELWQAAHQRDEYQSALTNKVLFLSDLARLSDLCRCLWREKWPLCDRERERQIERQTDRRQARRQADRQSGRWADKPMDRQIDR
jgi:hypothetical protein